MFRRNSWLRICRGLLLAVAALPVSIAVNLLPIKKTRDRSPEEVAKYLQDMIDGTGEDYDWDDFESVPITNLMLDGIRREAALAAPPNADLAKLADLLRRTRAINGPLG